MDPIIPATCIATLALGSSSSASASLITDQRIVIQQIIHIKPTLGESLYAAIAQGLHPQFTKHFLALPLSLLVKAAIITSADCDLGTMGVSRLQNANFTPLSASQAELAARTLRSQAYTLLCSAMEYVKANADQFPQYDPSQSVVGQVSISGGVIL